MIYWLVWVDSRIEVSVHHVSLKLLNRSKCRNNTMVCWYRNWTRKSLGENSGCSKRGGRSCLSEGKLKRLIGCWTWMCEQFGLLFCTWVKKKVTEKQKLCTTRFTIYYTVTHTHVLFTDIIIRSRATLDNLNGQPMYNSIRKHHEQKIYISTSSVHWVDLSHECTYTIYTAVSMFSLPYISNVHVTGWRWNDKRPEAHWFCREWFVFFFLHFFF